MSPQAIRTLFGSLLFILILHIIIKNLLHEPPVIAKNPHTKREIKRKIAKQAKQAAESGVDTDDERELMEYVSSKWMPTGSNYFTDYHPSDLHNEETDLSNYFSIEDRHGHLRRKTINTNAIDNGKHVKSKILKGLKEKDYGNINTESPTHYTFGADGSLMLKPDHWMYPDAEESVMNGSPLFGSVTGFDSMQQSYSVYQDL